MSDFNPGDRVRVKCPPGWLKDEGSPIGTIVDNAESYDPRLAIKMDDSGRTYYFYPVDLELIVEKQPQAFAVGDTVEFTRRGKVKVIGDFYVTMTIDNGDELIVDVDNLTKVAPPFPTRIGSHIKANIVGGNNNSYEFMLIKRDIITHNNWLCLRNTMFYAQSELELISVEYEPGD